MRKFQYSDRLSNTKEQTDFDTYLKQSFTRRIWLLGALVFAGFGGLFARMFYLQVRRHHYYSTRSQSNRVRMKPLVPERGTIYDRNGIALTENILRYQVIINPSQTQDVVALLSALTPILSLDIEMQEAFMTRYKKTRRYETVVVKSSISEEEHYRLAVQLHRLPGAGIKPYYQRYYPYGELCAHLLGYTNRINEKDLEIINSQDYRGIDFIGRAGIEKQYEDLLRGKSGYQQLETDANGNMVRLLKEEAAARGKDIYLALDLHLQRFIYETMGEHRGACVVLEPNSGEVLAMVSKPGYDTNLFTRGITQKQYQYLLNDPYGPLYDRALKGHYPPGSVVKPMLMLAGLYHQVITPKTHVHCSGEYHISGNKNGRAFHCWNRHGHGSLDAKSAVAQSCDVYFYSLGMQLGIDKISAYCQHFSMGRLTGIDMPDEDSGIMPTKQWKEKKYKTNWYIGDTINASIGQGFFTTTPLQLAYMTTLIARQGKSFVPRLLKRVYDPEKMTFLAVKHKQGERVPVYQKLSWQLAQESMASVMHSSHGTGHKITEGLPYQMAGKSGTVQVISFKGDKRIANNQLAKEHQDNAMFVAYAPLVKPEIAVSLIIERGGGGSSVAGPIVRQITDFYLLGQSS